MKRLNITNFSKRVMEIYSDYFMIKHCTYSEDRYIIGIEVNDVVSFKPLIGDKYYKMAIDKVTNEDGNYHIWLWDVGENISYPMSITPDALSSVSLFTSFLNHTLKLASDGSFSGDKGNRIDNK
jgi:hypothetical protein